MDLLLTTQEAYVRNVEIYGLLRTVTHLNCVRRGWAMGSLRPRMRSSFEMLAAAPFGGVKSENKTLKRLVSQSTHDNRYEISSTLIDKQKGSCAQEPYKDLAIREIL